MDDNEAQLVQLYESIKDCRRCDLSGGRTNVVFGAGSPIARVVFVGEAPGYHEDLQAEPFVGAAGRFLDELLKEVLGMTRDEIYIANVLKCRPPDNRDPTSVEVDTCKPFLLRQIEIISPLTVCTLGNFATRTLTGRKEGITKLRRKPIVSVGRFVFPMYHPAAALHRGDLYEEVRLDFEKLKEFLDSPPPLDEETPQMELF